MLFISSLIDIAAKLCGPRMAHEILLRRLERWRTFEPEYFLLDHLVDPARVAVDVGANEGIYAGRLSQLCSQVHCFEPIPWFAAALRKKLRPTVRVHECALSDQRGTGNLRIPYFNQVEMHGTTTLEPSNTLTDATHVRVVPCQLERLDDIVVDPVGFIKIDVEGHEAAVLKGATRILKEHQPVLLIESERRHNPSAPENIFQHLEGLGYSGIFFRQQRPWSTSAFDVEIHQQPILIGDNTHRYVNNFLFFPGKQMS